MTRQHTSATLYVLATVDADDGPLFWNNDHGFGDLEAADLFTEMEADSFSVPIADDQPEWHALPRGCRRPPVNLDRRNQDPMVRSTARNELLDAMHDLMSSYLVDECPEDEFWEDFDPDIARLRTEVDDLLDEETKRLSFPTAEPTNFVVEIEFRSEGELFATETYTVSAKDWPAAKCRAFDLADDSIYSDERIPDLTRFAIDRTLREPGRIRTHTSNLKAGPASSSSA